MTSNESTQMKAAVKRASKKLKNLLDEDDYP